MGDRNTSLFGKLTLRSRRRAAAASATPPSSAPASQTTFAETPTFFSGPKDYGLGYSSINHEYSETWSAKPASKSPASHATEFDRHAERGSLRAQSSRASRSVGRSRKPTSPLIDEDLLFVTVSREAEPRRRVQSTIRAQFSPVLSSYPSSPTVANDAFNIHPPQSPYTITRSSSQYPSPKPPTRTAPRRWNSADPSMTCASQSTPDLLIDVSEKPDKFYAVGRGWKTGVYTSKDDAQRQIKNFPGPLLKVFRDRAAAEDFVADAGRFPSQPVSSRDELDEELVERTRIFNGLDPKSEVAKHRTTNMSAERQEAQRQSRYRIAKYSPVPRQMGTFPSSPSLRSLFSDPGSPSLIEEINAPSTFPTQATLQSMTLLLVRGLANSIAFYTKVLGFDCISHIPHVQAVMSSLAATICLRSAEQASPSSTGAIVAHTDSSRANSNGANSDAPTNARTTLSTMFEDHINDTEPELPPTPDSTVDAFTEVDPFKRSANSLPLRTQLSTLSGATVLIEYNGGLESMHTLLSAKLNDWRLERSNTAQTSLSKSTKSLSTSPITLSSVQQTPWDAQELHLCDLDGHRITYTTPFLRNTLGVNPI